MTRGSLSVKFRNLVVVLLLLASWPALAAEAGGGSGSTAEGSNRIDKLVEALEQSDQSAFVPRAVDPAWLNDEGREAQRRAFEAYYDYRRHGFEHRRRVFEWQYYSSVAIFVLVVSLVTIGMYFSWMQFKQAERSGRSGHDTDTTLELSAKGVKVSSPILGVIILTISLAFLYLYLVYVYPIEEIL